MPEFMKVIPSINVVYNHLLPQKRISYYRHILFMVPILMTAYLIVTILFNIDTEIGSLPQVPCCRCSRIHNAFWPLHRTDFTCCRLRFKSGVTIVTIISRVNSGINRRHRWNNSQWQSSLNVMDHAVTNYFNNQLNQNPNPTRWSMN